MLRTFIRTIVISISCLLCTSPTANAALIPAIPVQTSVTGQVSLLLLPSGLTPSSTAGIEDLAGQETSIPPGLNPLSQVSISSFHPSPDPDSALNNIFNGINVAFPSSASSPIRPFLASLTIDANQILPTASGFLQAAIAGLLLPTVPASKSSLSTTSISSSTINQRLPGSCVDIFNVASLPPRGNFSTLITLQSACSPLSVYIDDVTAKSGLTAASVVPLLTSAEALTLASDARATTFTFAAASTSLISPGAVVTSFVLRDGASTLSLALPSALIAVTDVSSTAPTCTKSAPGSPVVTCMGGPDFSTLFCPHGCPTVFTSQCAFICKWSFGSELAGLFPAVQCAPVDLSLISPGTLSCQQCFPQCTNGTSTIALPSLPSGASNVTAGTVSVIAFPAKSSAASNITVLPTVTLPTALTTASAPTCTVVSPGAVDTPASQDRATGLLFRSSCGASAITVAQCPFLYSQGGASFFQECSNTDISGEQPTNQFPPIVCTRCLPPCSNLSISSSSFGGQSSGSVVLMIAAAVGGLVNSSRATLLPIVPAAPPFVNVSSAITPISTRQANQSTSSAAFVGLTSLASPIVSRLGSSVSLFGSTLASSTPASLTTILSSTLTCTSIVPSGTDTPAIVEPNTGLVVRSSCGLTAETIAQCPFICSAGGGAPNGNCSMEDMTGRLMYGSYPPLVCHQCLPPCKAATIAPAGPTCSSISPNSPDPSALIDLSGLLHRDSCGTSATTIAECPFLCGLRDQGLVLRQCFHQDLTNKTITGQAANLEFLVCEKCLPPCESSALPSCRRHFLGNVDSLARALPATIPGLVGSVPIQPIIRTVSITVPAVAGSIEAQSAIGAISAIVPAIVGGVSTAIPALANSIKAQSIAKAVPAAIEALAGSIITALPSMATSRAPQSSSTVALPTSDITAAPLPVTAIPSSLITPLQHGDLLPPVLAARDTAQAFPRRDVVSTIVEDSPAAQLQWGRSGGVPEMLYHYVSIDDPRWQLRREKRT